MMQVFSYDVTLTDFQNAYALFNRTCKKVSNVQRRIRIFATLWLISGVWIMFTQPQTRSQPIIVSLTLVSLWMLFGLPMQQRNLLKKQWKKLLVSPADTLPITLKFDEQEISFLLKGKSEVKFYWPAVVGVAEDASTFLILVSERQFYYVAKRVLSDESLSQLRAVAPVERAYKC